LVHLGIVGIAGIDSIALIDTLDFMILSTMIHSSMVLEEVATYHVTLDTQIHMLEPTVMVDTMDTEITSIQPITSIVVMATIFISQCMVTVVEDITMVHVGVVL
jgi:hypothetical protein